MGQISRERKSVNPRRIRREFGRNCGESRAPIRLKRTLIYTRMCSKLISNLGGGAAYLNAKRRDKPEIQQPFPLFIPANTNRLLLSS